MTTVPAVIGTTRLRAHRSNPCRFLTLPILAGSPRPRGARVRVPNAGWALFGPIVVGTQEPILPQRFTGILRTCRGLSPLPFCYLIAAASMTRGSTMPTPDPTISVADPALLRIDGPIATITLNRPTAFNSIDLSIAKKLEQLGAAVEACPDPGARHRRRRPRLLRRRRSADHWSGCGADNVAPVVGELLQHYHAFIETLRRMPKIVLSSVHGSAAGAGMGLAFVADSASPPKTPASRRPIPSRRLARWRLHGRHGGTSAPAAHCKFSCRRQFFGAQAYEWGLVARVVPAAELKAATRKFAERLAQNPPAAIAGTKSLVYQAAVTPPGSSSTRRRSDHRLHADGRIPRRGEKIHQQGLSERADRDA